MDKFKARIESWQKLADIFIKENKDVFVKDYNGNLYMGKVIFNGESILYIQCFAPEQRAGKKCEIYWVSVERFTEYREREE